MYRAVKWWLYIVWLSFKWVWRINLSDQVVYNGQIWTLYQGVNHPRWKMCRGSHDDNTWESALVHCDEFRKVWTPRNLWGSFRCGYRFYMGYWFDIWVMNNSASFGPRER